MSGSTKSAEAPRKRRAIKVIAIVAGGAVAGAALFGVGYVGFLGATASDVLEVPQAPIILDADTEPSRPTPAVPASAQRLPTCSVDELAGDSRLGTLNAVVVDPWSGGILFDRGGAELVAPASVLKVVTAAAAISVMGPDRTFATEVHRGEDDSVLYLVAGGDPTLRVSDDAAESVYRDSASLETLARQTIETLTALNDGEAPAISELVVDATLWDLDDSWDDSWATSARSNGYLSRVHPLQVDGDRADAAVAMSPRGNNPALRAANAFVAELKAAGNTSRQVSVTFAERDGDSELVASVESAPLSVWIEYMLKESDNTLAEVLARHISLELGFDGSATSIAEAMPIGLSAYGVSAEGMTIRDGSGLSSQNQVTPAFISSLLVAIFQSQGPLGEIREALPLAGVDGSLDDRFVGANSVAAGQASAKTGSISGTRSLAGVIEAEDDTQLTFAFFATGDVDDSARAALESLVAGVYSCGGNLADF